MYGALSDFLLSNLKGLDESRQMVPLFLERLHPLTDYADKLPITDVQNLEHLQQCDFLEEPESVVRQALDHFGLPCDSERLNQLASSGPLSRHSKSGDRYDSGTRADENAALLEQHGGVLNETLKWMDSLLDDFPIVLPLRPQL